MSGRGVASVAVAGLLFGAAACTTGGGGGGGGGGPRLLPDGSLAPSCTATVNQPPPGPEPVRTPPTFLEDRPSDLRLETPGFGIPASTSDRGARTVSDDNSKLLFRTKGQSVVPGGFLGDSALVLRDRTTGTNTVIASQKNRNTALFEGQFRQARFLPGGDVAFPEHGYWLPLPPDEGLVQFYDHYQTQVFKWDVDTHDFDLLSVGLDGKPIAPVPLGVYAQPGVDLPPSYGPRNIQVSADGRYVFFMTANRVDPAETQAPLNLVQDLFRRDTLTGEIVQVNVGNYDELGINANRGGWDIWDYDISDDGRYVLFKTWAVNALAETGWCEADLLFTRDIEAETTTLVSHDNNGNQRFGSSPAFMSPDGRYVMWKGGRMPNLPAGTSMIWDRETGQHDWFLPEQDGTPAGGPSDNTPGFFTNVRLMAASDDLSKVLLNVVDDDPNADGVIPGDGDGNHELVLFDRSANTVRKVSQLPDGTSLTTTFDDWIYQVEQPTLSPDGSVMFFASHDALLPSDTNQAALPTDASAGWDLYSMAL